VGHLISFCASTTINASIDRTPKTPEGLIVCTPPSCAEDSAHNTSAYAVPKKKKAMVGLLENPGSAKRRYNIPSDIFEIVESPYSVTQTSSLKDTLMDRPTIQVASHNNSPFSHFQNIMRSAGS